ncbi:mechanosensitive ion channel family protein [Treponema bryantii]|uniref:mechanosensitive ion channel family protein n=1 Tax=Treponema bryantii TaxID=163 RepID=UPI00041B4927|nr:mechanosensitive ion channel family protein [Treponema bryantii]
MNDTINSIGEAASNAANDIFFDKTSSFVNWILSFLTWENLFKLIGSLLILFVIWLVFRIVAKAIRRVPETKLPAQRAAIVIKFVRYIFYIVVVLYVLGLFGINLKAIWGAAGIAGVAIGFAAQTSVSNLISGLFVLTEGSIHVGDTIIVGGVTGIVDEVKLLSIRVHTFDNQMVRIPNSTIIGSNLTNNSYHDKRRLTLNVGVDYSTDMKLALETLKKAPALCPTVLSDPAPAVWFDGFADSSINLVVAVWFKPADFLQTKNDLYIAIKQVLDEAGISIPFNQLDVKIKQ